MPTVFRQRRGTAAALAAANEVPSSGQIIVETDTSRMKVGDGVTAYNSLPYLNTPISSVAGLQAALDGKQAVGSYAASVHTHSIAQITGLQNSLDGKQPVGSYAASVHTHAIAQIDGLQAALDSKQPTGGFAEITHAHGAITSDGRIGTTAGRVLTTGGGGTLQASATIPASAVSGLAASATVDATNASNISDGTLSISRIPVGTDSFSVCRGNDNRLTGPREPISHASTHASGGVDYVSPASIGAAEVQHAHGNLTTDGKINIPGQGTIISSGHFLVTGAGGSITLTSTVDASKVAGLAASATTDTTNANHITSGRLAKDRLPTDTLYSADLTPIYAALDGKQSAGTYATLVNGTVPPSQLPSYVDDVVEAATFAALPSSGETGKIYVTSNNNKVYRWSGTAYIEIVASPGSTDAIAEGATNLYFTNARVVSALPSDVFNVHEAADFSALGASPGAANRLYVTRNDRTLYWWTGTSYLIVRALESSPLTTTADAQAGVNTNRSGWSPFLVRTCAQAAVTWSNLSGRPDTFTPSAHTHTASSITDFSAAVAAASPEEVIEATTVAGFPATGNSSALYIATSTSRFYRWTGSVYVEVGPVATYPATHTHTASQITGGTATTFLRGDGTFAAVGPQLVLSAWSQENSINANANSNLRYTQPTTDTDSAYSASTGIYTVPAGKSGIYAVYCGFVAEGGTKGTTSVDIKIFGTTLGEVSLNGGATYATVDGALRFAGMVFVPLTAGEEVNLRTYATAALTSNNNSSTFNVFTLFRM